VDRFRVSRFPPRTRRPMFSGSSLSRARRPRSTPRCASSTPVAAFSYYRRQAKDLQRYLGADDRDRLDQYFTSVRDLETPLLASRGGSESRNRSSTCRCDRSGKPAEFMAKVKIMYDLARLAFETDSNRAITLMLDGVAPPSSRSRTRRSRMESQSLPPREAETSCPSCGDRPLAHEAPRATAGRAEAVREGEDSLLDRTMVSTVRILATRRAHQHEPADHPRRWRFRHGQHLAFDTAPTTTRPVECVCSMLQRMGIEQDRSPPRPDVSTA